MVQQAVGQKGALVDAVIACVRMAKFDLAFRPIAADQKACSSYNSLGIQILKSF
jgi:hypothetical protein